MISKMTLKYGSTAHSDSKHDYGYNFIKKSVDIIEYLGGASTSKSNAVSAAPAILSVLEKSSEISTILVFPQRHIKLNSFEI